MFVRRVPAIVLSFVLGAAALVMAPVAFASDGGSAPDAQKDRDPCGPGTTSFARLRVTMVDGNNSRLLVTGAVFSEDDDVWSWRLRHDGDLSASGEVRARDDIDRSFKVTRSMLNFSGVDNVVFRAENQRTGEVCKGEVDF